jgi:hypothetical protein
MDLTESVLKTVSTHCVGNKALGQELKLAKSELELKEDVKNLLGQAFLSRFSDSEALFSFGHPSSLQYNELYNYCLDLFAGEKPVLEVSRKIAQHLYDNTEHPKIKNGQLYICYYEQCIYDGNYVDAIGIYKTERQSHFMTLDYDEGNTEVFALNQGVEITDLDKGCLVFPTSAENGFDVLLFDTNKGEEAAFWRDKFLSITPQANDYFQTNQFLTVTKEFIAKHAPENLELTKTDQIDLLNRSVDYFKGNAAFNKTSFEQEVFYEEDLIKSFRGFEKTYAEENDVALPDTFTISSSAVKKQARVFKSVLKLDKNFHVYIHGDKSLIEKGYDEHLGKNYYKIYFDEEE